jgi:chromosomal replication initiation ATPase DnaA
MNYYTTNPDTLTIGALDATPLFQQERVFSPQDCETLPEAILGAVAHYYGTTSVELVQPGRDEPRATQRLTAAYLIKKVAKLSNTKLALLLQRGHASTVSHLMPSVERKVASGKISQEDIIRLNSIIGEISKNWDHECD